MLTSAIGCLRSANCPVVVHSRRKNLGQKSRRLENNTDLKVTRDECNAPTIPGRRGHPYFDGAELCLMVLDGKPAIRSKMEGAGRQAVDGGYQQERPRRAGSGRENHRMNAEEFVTVVKLHERRSRQRYFEGPGAPAWEVPVRKTSATVTLVQPICQRQTKRCLEPRGIQMYNRSLKIRKWKFD